MQHPRSFTRAALAALLGAALGAGGLALAAAPDKSGFAPDPPARASRKQWVFDISVQKGAITVERAKSVTLDKPVETARAVGRFALELRIGKELLDRVRFNVPLMDTPQEDRPKRPLKGPRFDAVTAHIKVQMADNPRATYMLLIDRATGDAKRYTWPPAVDGTLSAWTQNMVEADAGEVTDGGVKVFSINDKSAKDGGKPDKTKADDGAADAGNKVEEKAPKDAGGD